MAEYADPVIDWLDQSKTLFDKRYFRQVRAFFFFSMTTAQTPGIWKYTESLRLEDLYLFLNLSLSLPSFPFEGMFPPQRQLFEGLDGD